jgi:hypothetical protein
MRSLPMRFLLGTTLVLFACNVGGGAIDAAPGDPGGDLLAADAAADTMPDGPDVPCDLPPDLPDIAPDVASPDVPPDADDLPPDADDLPPDADDLPPDADDLPPDADDLPPDVVLDVGIDPGNVTCYDCECVCAGGTYVPYGGCYPDGATVPDDILHCSADCTGMCPFEAGRTCSGDPGGQGTCGVHELCLEQPCPHCGIPPQSYCVPEPCAIDGCWLDAGCGEAGHCVGADIPSAGIGQCLPDTAPPDCWIDADCPPQAACEDAVHCPRCFACAMMTRPGTCKARPGQEGLVLHVPGGLFSPGEPVVGTWYNLGKPTVWLAGCSTCTLEVKDPVTGAWVDQGPPAMCGVEGVARRLADGDAVSDFPWQAEEGPGGPATWRLHGQYWTGCKDGLPISQAGCTGGPIDLLGGPFTVGMVP